MAYNGLPQELAEVESLLLSRKRLVSSNVTLPALDAIIDRRMAIIVRNATHADLDKDGALLLGKVTQIRQDMEALKFDLTAVDDLATHIIRAMNNGEQVATKPFTMHKWSVRVSKFTAGRHYIASDKPPSCYLELVEVSDYNNSNTAVTSIRLFDGYKDLSLAGSNFFCFAIGSIEAVVWSHSNQTIHLRSWYRNAMGVKKLRDIFIETLQEPDVHKIFEKLVAGGLTRPIVVVTCNEMEAAFVNRE
ncbi:MAG: hypothetical protein LQ346_006196 [Caloplaca aetnensis]|nr:MAG: hypothetical protein LQ346_006196 [Caloplaca aetnensis]